MLEERKQRADFERPPAETLMVVGFAPEPVKKPDAVFVSNMPPATFSVAPPA
jgi:hypothetical protein